MMKSARQKTKAAVKWYGVRKGKRTGVKRMTYKEAETWKMKQFKSFNCEEDARKYTEVENVEEIDWNEVQAIAYVDGSLNFDNETINEDEKYASYGLILYVRDRKEPFYVESGRMQDGTEKKGDKRNLSVSRYDMAGHYVDRNRMKADPGRENVWYTDVFQGRENKHGFVAASWSDASEGFGAYRAMQICFEELELDRIAIVYDHQALWDICFDPNQNKNVPYFVGNYFKKWDEKGKKIHFIEVNSHDRGDYEKTDPLFVHGVFNDCVDMLAKAETKKNPIGASENRNAVKVIDSIHDMTKNDISVRRMQARQYVAAVTEKINPFDEMMK